MQKYTTVTEFLESLDDSKRAQVEELRKIIMVAGPELSEHIKWNAPSYGQGDTDRITFNILNKEGVVKLVLHMDTKRKENKKASPVMTDTSGMISWSSDIRGMLSFTDLDDVKSKQGHIVRILTDWLSIDPADAS
jgi:hypothetical protein